MNDIIAGLVKCTQKRTKNNETVRGRRKCVIWVKNEASHLLLHERQAMYSIKDNTLDLKALDGSLGGLRSFQASLQTPPSRAKALYFIKQHREDQLGDTRLNQLIPSQINWFPLFSPPPSNVYFFHPPLGKESRGVRCTLLGQINARVLMCHFLRNDTVAKTDSVI